MKEQLSELVLCFCLSGYSGGQKFGSSTPLSFGGSKSLSSSAFSDYPFAKAVKSVGPFVVGVSVKPTRYGIALTGSGLLIDEKTVLTCAHCVVYEKLMEKKSPHNDSVKKVTYILCIIYLVLSLTSPCNAFVKKLMCIIYLVLSLTLLIFFLGASNAVNRKMSRWCSWGNVGWFSSGHS